MGGVQGVRRKRNPSECFEKMLNGSKKKGVTGMVDFVKETSGIKFPARFCEGLNPAQFLDTHLCLDKKYFDLKRLPDF